MRLIGLLVTLAILGYTIHLYLESSNLTTTNGIQTKPAEYIDQAKKSVNVINKAMQNQQDQFDKTRK